jgi:hypothetical protein
MYKFPVLATFYHLRKQNSFLILHHVKEEMPALPLLRPDRSVGHRWAGGGGVGINKKTVSRLEVCVFVLIQLYLIISIYAIFLKMMQSGYLYNIKITLGNVSEFSKGSHVKTL